MSQRVITGNKKLAEAIRSRRKELGLTIEEAAAKAGVGVKTWCRYESGESMRQDKAKGICKALNWHEIPKEENVDEDFPFSLNEYKKNKAWSKYISKAYGEAAAISFIVGSEIVLDHVKDDLEALSKMPKGTHIGQLPFSWIKDALPEQFLMNYDYDFLYCFKMTIVHLRKAAHYADEFCAHSVMEELALYIFMTESEFLMDCMMPEMKKCKVTGLDLWNEWAFDLFDDADIVTWLYSDFYVPEDNCYHFCHWKENQFYMKFGK